MMKTICIITGTRAEYGLFFPILKKIQASCELKLQLIATTMHLSSAYGLSYQQIEDDGFVIDYKLNTLIEEGKTTDNAHTTAKTLNEVSTALSDLKPDIVLLLGDRFETFAAASAALLLNLPIAHIHGGELSFGAVDEQLRHAITKMSHLHFTSTIQYKNRVIQMGESPNKVYVTGAPGLDNIINQDILSKELLFKNLNLEQRPFILFTYHAQTLQLSTTKEDIYQILQTIKESKLFCIFTYANADTGGKIINKALEQFHQDNKETSFLIKNLGQKRYLSALKHCDFLLGNSSSGIIEAASFSTPVINIGSRQEGRTQNTNVINTGIKDLKQAFIKVQSLEFKSFCKNVKNIYGEGKASSKIVDILIQADLNITKRFYDYEY